jgi:hypothetical protein
MGFEKNYGQALSDENGVPLNIYATLSKLWTNTRNRYIYFRETAHHDSFIRVSRHLAACLDILSHSEAKLKHSRAIIRPLPLLPLCGI